MSILYIYSIDIFTVTIYSGVWFFLKSGILELITVIPEILPDFVVCMCGGGGGHMHGWPSSRGMLEWKFHPHSSTPFQKVANKCHHWSPKSTFYLVEIRFSGPYLDFFFHIYAPKNQRTLTFLDVSSLLLDIGYWLRGSSVGYMVK